MTKHSAFSRLGSRRTLKTPTKRKLLTSSGERRIHVTTGVSASKHMTGLIHERLKVEQMTISELSVSVESDRFEQCCMPLGPQARGGQEEVCCKLT